MDQAVSHTERQLLQQLCGGDRQAFTTIYLQQYPTLHRYLVVMTKSEEKADEILQDVFLKLWIKRATLDGIRSLKDYLFRMTKNRLLDNFKKDERHRNFLKEATSEQSNEDAMDAVILKEYHQLVRDGLKTMPERRQEIFLMNARDEMTAKEIADKLNLTTSVVKRQIFEAQQQLRKYLREHGDILMLLMLACSTINANLLS